MKPHDSPWALPGCLGLRLALSPPIEGETNATVHTLTHRDTHTQREREREREGEVEEKKKQSDRRNKTRY